MRRPIVFFLVSAFLLSVQLFAQTRLASDDAKLTQEPSYQGKPLSYWIEVIRNRDEPKLGRALVAIQNLGPKASAAVDELAGIVAAPFVST